MTKAEKYINIAKEVECILGYSSEIYGPEGESRKVAVGVKVTEQGDLDIYRLRKIEKLSKKEALKLAYWIIDVFIEEK